MNATTLAPTAATADYAALKRALRDAAARDPIDTLLTLVLGGALLFFLAETGHNPKIATYYDALVYVSTALSVGYADTFPRTSAGKAIAGALMTFGPALAARALDAPADERAAPEIDPRVLAKLDAILSELKAQRGTSAPAG